LFLYQVFFHQEKLAMDVFSDAGGPTNGDQGSDPHRAASGHDSEVARTLKTMDTLPPLVVTKQITPAECNAVMGVLKTKLAHFAEKEQKFGTDPAGNSVPHGLKEALRERPDLLNFMARWLSAEELAELIDDDELGDREANDRENADGA
jgi:hypothetical protein